MLRPSAMGTIFKLLLVGCLVALMRVDQLTPTLAGWLDSGGDASAEPAPRVDPSGEAQRPVGFRTSHLRFPTAEPNEYDPLIRRYSSQQAVPAELVRAVVQVESGFDPDARSEKGAMGLMQLMPETAAELGVADPFDPSENIRGGVTYLNRLLRRFDGNEALALAAYNAGPGAVARYGNRIPPYAETQQYVKSVRSIARAAARRVGEAEAVYKSYAVVDGRWTVVYSNAPPPAGRYELTTEVTPEELAALAAETSVAEAAAPASDDDERG